MRRLLSVDAPIQILIVYENKKESRRLKNNDSEILSD